MFHTSFSILVKSLLFAVLFSVIAVIGVYTYVYYKDNHVYKNRVYTNVYVNGAEISGATREDIISKFEKQNDKLAIFSLSVGMPDGYTATFSGRMLGIAYDPQTIAEMSLLVGREQDFFTAFIHKLQLLLFSKPVHLFYTPHYNIAPITEFLNQLEESYDQAPENARFEMKKGKVTGFSIERMGKKVNTEKVINEIETILKGDVASLQQYVELTVSIDSVEPDITIGDANKFGIKEKIGEGVSDYTGSSSERVHNIILSTSKFHGLLIPPNTVFSFNEAIGEISSATGYKQAYVIIDGKTVMGDGGGVCQTSTTFFRASLKTGLEIIERRAHGYRVSYYENDQKPGLDATVYNPTTDLKVKNDTPAYILIQTAIDKNKNLVYFTFYGKSDGRVVTITDIRVWDEAPPPEPLYQDDPTLQHGVVKQIEWPAWGAKSSYQYIVMGDDLVLHDETIYSSYRPWRAVYLVGVGEE